MPDQATYKALKAEIDLLNRKHDQLVEMLINKLGLELAQPAVDDAELNAIIDHCNATGNYRPLQDYQRKKNTRNNSKPPGIAA